MAGAGNGLSSQRELLDSAGVETTLVRLADEVFAAECGVAMRAPLVVGIVTGGAHLAARLASLLSDRLGTKVPLGSIDIALYRDDVHLGLARPRVAPAVLPTPVEGQSIILVDDVLFTGRTVRAALDEIIDFGRPLVVRLAVLVDRGLRELPIRPDYVGVVVDGEPGDRVKVELRESGADQDRVVAFSQGGCA